MKGKIPRILRLALVAILVASFSLVPLAINPKPASAATAVTGYTAKAEPNTKNTAAKFTIGFTTTMELAIGNYIKIDFTPVGSVQPNNNSDQTANVKLEVTTQAGVLVGTDTSNDATAVWTTADEILTITTAVKIPANASVKVELATGSTLRTQDANAVTTLSVITETDTTAVTPSYRVGNVVLNTDVIIAHEGNEYIAAATSEAISTKPNIALVEVGDVLTIQSAVGCFLANKTVTSKKPSTTTFANDDSLLSILYALVTTKAGNFTRAAPITAKIEGSDVPITPAGATVGSGAEGDPGNGCFTVALKVPPLNGSSNFEKSTAVGDDQLVEISDGTYKVQFKIWVIPKALVTPDSGKTGTTVTIVGTGFSKSKGITIYSNNANFLTGGTALGPKQAAKPNLTTAIAVSSGAIVADSNGSFSGTFKSLSGTTYVAAVDGDGNWAVNAPMAIDETDITFSPLGTVTLSPTSGKPGDRVTFTVTDYPAKVPILVWFGLDAASTTKYGDSLIAATVNLNAIQTSPAQGTLASDDNGQVLSGSFIVPSVLPHNTGVKVLPGDYIVRVRGATGTASTDVANQGSASASFTVKPLGLTLSKTSAARYDKVTIAVSGMTANGVICGETGEEGLKLGGTAWNAVATSTSNTEFVSGFQSITLGSCAASGREVQLDSAGNGTFTIRVRSNAPLGSQVVEIVDSGNAVAQGSLTVKVPTISVTPSEAVRNEVVTVSGKGWVPEQSVSVTVNTPTTTTFSSTPDGAGNFAVTFNVSTSAQPGTTYTVDANDGITGTAPRGNTAAAATFKMKDTAISISPTTVKWGATVTIKGSGFKGGSQMLYGLPWKTAAGAASFPAVTYSDSAGNFTASLLIPTVEKGVHSLGVTDDDRNFTATATITIEEAPATVVSALAPIAASLVRVWGFEAGAWKLYDPAVPAELNTLAALNKGGGYFINVKAATSILSGGVTINLSVGWNLIGWLG